MTVEISTSCSIEETRSVAWYQDQGAFSQGSVIEDENIARYKLRDGIGSGNYGAVYLADFLLETPHP
jgi:serine/threonine protein kinase